MSQPKPELDELHHVAIEVKDLAATVEWYRERFRCELLYQDDTWALLGFRNTQLAFVVPEEHPPHVAVSHVDAESFGKLDTHRDGTRSCYLEDPSGNAVEIMDEASL